MAPRCPGGRLAMRGGGQRVGMEHDPQDRTAADAPEDQAPEPQGGDEAAEARREYEEDPSLNPPDERLNDLRGG
jgi:hypothetical protein